MSVDGIAGDLRRIGRESWDIWKNEQLPYSRNAARRADQLGGTLLDNVRNYASPSRIAREEGMAASTAARVWDQEKQGLMRTLGRYGMQPGRFGGALRALALGRGANIAGSRNAARSGVLDRDMNNKMGLYNMMRGSQVINPGMGLSALGSAGQMLGQVEQAKRQEKSGMWSGLGSLAGGAITAFALMSDIRAKQDIKRIDTLPGDIALYEFRYKGGDQMVYTGVMAQELAQVKPHLVIEDAADGMMMVDYGGLLRELTIEAAALERAA